MSTQTPATVQSGWLAALNGRHHKFALGLFMLVVTLHWAEHIAQAIQIWVLGWPRPKSLGIIGVWYPPLFTSEWLHYGFAVVMLVALFALRRGFSGTAKTWWTVALAIQFWHHIEHLLLLVQAQSHHNLAGRPVPTSILQLFYPRVELHLFYNAIVFIPMVIAMIAHTRPRTVVRAERETCTCAPELPVAA